MHPLDDTPEAILARDAFIRRLAAAVAGASLSADDVVQDVWLQARSSDSPPRDPRAWYARLVHNVAHNLRRAERRRLVHERAASRPATDAGSNPFDLVVYEERRRQLVEAVESLPRAQRDVLIARYWEGLEPTAIARRNGERADAVRQRLRRAHLALREIVDARTEDRRAWLVPLAGGTWSPASIAGAGAAVVGGIAMKKTLAVALLLLTVAGSWWAILSEPLSEPVDSAELPSAARELSAPSAVGEAEERHLLLSTGREDSTSRFTLSEADGRPASGIEYWADERPFRNHPAVAPEGCPRTSADGQFDPHAEALGPARFLWFAVDDSLRFAVDRTELGGSKQLRLPGRVEVDVEIRGLLPGQPWEIGVYPGWVDPRDGDLTHGSAHAQLLPGQSSHWILRRYSMVRAPRGPARRRVRLVQGLPAAFYCFSDRVDIEPDIREVYDPRGAIVAHAGPPRELFEVRVLEPDGVTRSDVDGNVYLHTNRGSASSRPIKDGTARLSRSRGRPRGGHWLGVVLEDGEGFRIPLTDPRIHRGPWIVVRGTGVPALLRLPAALDPGTDWDEARVRIEVDGRWCAPSRRPWFHPVPDDDERSLGAWVHDGHLVVAGEIRARDIARIVLSHSEGTFAERRGDRVVQLKTVALDPLQPRRFLGPSTVDIDLALEVEWAPGDWQFARILRFVRPDDFGWRMCRTASIDRHEAVPEAITFSVPAERPWRMRWRSGRSGWTERPPR